MPKSEPFYDSLYVGLKLQEKLEDFSRYEIQLFCYLACLLSLYDGKTLSSWGYLFIKNELGSPYSTDLDDAFNSSIQMGFFLDSQKDFVKISQIGVEKLDFFSDFHSYKSRLPYLEAACNSINFLNYGIVKTSINKEPILYSANLNPNKRLLSDEKSPSFSLLYEQFDMLKTALEDKYKNLIFPAVVWLEYLNKNNSFDSYANT